MAAVAPDISPPKLIDVKGFVDSLGGMPVFTRAILQNAADQISKAKQGESIELLDCYGVSHRAHSKAFVDAGTVPTLVYNSEHVMADTEPWSLLLQVPDDKKVGMLACCGINLQELPNMVQNARMPVYIQFTDPPHIIEYDMNLMMENMMGSLHYWRQNPRSKPLIQGIAHLKATASITKIVCLGLGSISRGGPRVCGQHICIAHILGCLEYMYEHMGRNTSIKLLAQDPEYLPGDKAIFARFGFEVLEDPEAFLAIDDTTLVMACRPSIPVRQIIADLAAEDPRKRPAAIFWDSDPFHGMRGVDLVNYRVDEPLYYGNPVSRRSIDMLKHFVKVFDGQSSRQELDKDVGENNDEAHEDPRMLSMLMNWLDCMELWARID